MPKLFSSNRSKNYTKHKVLELIEAARERLGVDQFIYIDLLLVITKKFPDYEDLKKSLQYLIADGYVDENFGGCVRLSKKGSAALFSDYFTDLGLKRKKDIAGFILTIIVGICNIVALYISVVEIREINRDLKQSQQDIRSMQDKQFQQLQQMQFLKNLIDASRPIPSRPTDSGDKKGLGVKKIKEH